MKLRRFGWAIGASFCLIATTTKAPASDELPHIEWTKRVGGNLYGLEEYGSRANFRTEIHGFGGRIDIPLRVEAVLVLILLIPVWG